MSYIVKNIKNLYNNWCKIDDKIRFVFIGGINAAFSFGIFVLLVFLMGEQYHQICLVLQWLISSVFAFCNQKFFVFCSKGNFWKEYLKYTSTWAFGYVLNIVLLEILFSYFGNIYISQFISLCIVSILTYVLFKYFAFKK